MTAAGPGPRGRVVLAAVRMAGVAALVLAAVFGSSGLGARAGADAGAAAPVGSALTVHGSGRFANLAVTVSQTQDLIDQVVKVSWTGGVPTDPVGVAGIYRDNYLQIMQCWSDDGGAAHPDRTQCQFGAGRDSRGGSWSDTRQVGITLTDPAEPLIRGDHPGNATVPFRPANGGAEAPTAPNAYFDGNTTNEVAFARTSPDGTGQAYVETQTSQEATGLGCGTVLTDASGAVERNADGTVRSRSCWLVVVPRGTDEVDGLPPGDRTDGGRLASSPLSMTNWADHIEIPLHFEAIGAACTIGAHEVGLIGQEVASEAVTRWQPALCSTTGTVYGFSQVSDDTARRQLASGTPGLVMTSRPLAAGALPTGYTAQYAPVALSALTIAFDIDSQSPENAPPDVKSREGQRITSLNLTPRLVAKLLTQSYGGAVFDRAGYLAGNPATLYADPDFLQYNPQFKDLLQQDVQPLLPLDGSDAARELWTWVDSDAEARAWLDGHADKWGMKVNKNYLGIALPVDNYPKADLSCIDVQTIPQPDCVLTAYPYANDMHDAANSASRGDTLAKDYNLSGIPPGWTAKTTPQSNGQRSIIAVADAATAQRYSLPVANLRNAAGNFVAPTAAALDAGLAAMTPSGTSGVLSADPATTAADAYPLTTLTYAATVPAQISAGDGADYRKFIDYAVGAGQTLGYFDGDLPYGYAPLPASLRADATRVADTIASTAGHRPPTPTTAPAPVPAPVAATTAAPVAPVAAPPAGSSAPPEAAPSPAAAQPVPADVTTAAAPTARAGTTTPAPSRSTPAAVAVSYMPHTSAGFGRWTFVLLLAVGGVAALAGPGLLFGHRLPRLRRR